MCVCDIVNCLGLCGGFFSSSHGFLWTRGVNGKGPFRETKDSFWKLVFRFFGGQKKSWDLFFLLLLNGGRALSMRLEEWPRHLGFILRRIRGFDGKLSQMRSDHPGCPETGYILSIKRGHSCHSVILAIFCLSFPLPFPP